MICRPTGASEWNGWGNGLANTRFQSAQAAGLSSDDVPHLKLKWAFGLPAGGETSGEPSVFGGRIFFGDYNSFVYSLDAATGCVYWSFHADAQIRTAALVAPTKRKGNRLRRFLRRQESQSLCARRAHRHAASGSATSSSACSRTSPPRPFFTRVGSTSGSPAPKKSFRPIRIIPVARTAAASPRSTRIRGAVIWKTYTIPEEPKPTKKNALGTQLWAPAGASIWSAPTIDPKLNAIYVGTGNGFTEPAAKTSDSIMAFDLKTGKVLWSYQALANDASPGDRIGPGPKDAHCPAKVGPDWDFGNSPILQTLANGKRVLVCAHKGGEVVALDPDRRGALLWTADLSAGRDTAAPIQVQIMWGGAADKDNVYYDNPGRHRSGSAPSRWEGSVECSDRAVSRASRRRRSPAQRTRSCGYGDARRRLRGRMGRRLARPFRPPMAKKFGSSIPRANSRPSMAWRRKADRSAPQARSLQQACSSSAPATSAPATACPATSSSPSPPNSASPSKASNVALVSPLFFELSNRNHRLALKLIELRYDYPRMKTTAVLPRASASQEALHSARVA